MTPILSIRGLGKVYASGHRALAGVDLDLLPGEIFALLGPNGAGKTTLIGAICGLVRPTEGTIVVDGHDAIRSPRPARQAIGLVPQELSTDAFETVLATVTFSRGLFGRPRDPALVESILRELALWDKRGEKIMALSGGMKRRVLIAKALAHEPRILFLDEPTAGVDVELRRDLWRMVRGLRDRGVTVILTTHYLEEAEEMADRIGIIVDGKILLVEEKAALLEKLGRRQLSVRLRAPLERLPEGLGADATLSADGTIVEVGFGAQGSGEGVVAVLRRLGELGLEFVDLSTKESSLEEIFVDLVRRKP